MCFFITSINDIQAKETTVYPKSINKNILPYEIHKLSKIVYTLLIFFVKLQLFYKTNISKIPNQRILIQNIIQFE